MDKHHNPIYCTWSTQEPLGGTWLAESTTSDGLLANGTPIFLMATFQAQDGRAATRCRAARRFESTNADRSAGCKSPSTRTTSVQVSRSGDRWPNHDNMAVWQYDHFRMIMKSSRCSEDEYEDGWKCPTYETQQLGFQDPLCRSAIGGLDLCRPFFGHDHYPEP